MNISIGIGIPRAAVTLRKRGASPKEIFGSSLELWLRSDVGITTVSGAVSEWADVLSGKGRTFSQGTAASRPAYNTTDANWNGLPSIACDGINDHIDSDDAAPVWTFLHDGSGGCIIVVGRFTHNGTSQRIVSTNTSITSNGIALRISASASRFYQVGNGTITSLDLTSVTTLPGVNAYLIGAYEDGRAGNEGLLSVSGEETTGDDTAAPAVTAPQTTLAIGAATNSGSPSACDIVEVIACSVYPTAAQFALIDAYIERRYGLWTPASIFGAGLHTWLRSDDLALADGASVSAWADRSGNGHDFSMATPSRQPTFNASDSSYRGKPSLTFASDRLESDDLASVWSYLHDGTGGTLVVVGEYTGVTGGNNNMASTRDTIGTGRGVAMEIDGSNDMRLRISNGTADIVDLTETADTETPRYFIAAYEDGRAGNEALVAVSSNETTGNDTGAPSVSDPQLTLSLGGLAGGGKYCPCKIVEVIAVTRYLTDSEKTRLATYFSRRYGL